MLKKLQIISFLLCIFTLNVYSNESAGGLLFTSSAEKVDKRTSMVVFGEKRLKLTDSFELSFDLSILDTKQFGHIFRLINEQKKEIEFVFVNFYGIDNMYLDFHSPITHKSVQIPISKKTIEQKEILNIYIQFDLKQDKASIRLRDSVYTCSPIGLENPSSLQFAFGLYGLNLDVPQMMIRNLRIDGKNGKPYYFPLKESSGDFAHDESGKVKATVKNPEWIVNKHFYWEKKSSFKVRNKAFVTYNENENRLLFINQDSIISYLPSIDKVETTALNEIPRDIEIADAVFNPFLSQVIIFGADSVRTFNKSVDVSNKIFINYLNPKQGRNLLHHNNFFSSSGELYRFGGFGNYTYSDKISLLNRECLEWEEPEFSGDKITPRFYSASGSGVNPDEILIFGGFGNETGKLEHVGHNLYDLYQLNLDERKIKKLWELRESPKNEFVPGNNLIVSKDKFYFYALCFAQHQSNSYGYLQRFNLKNGLYETVSDSLSLTSEDMNTTVNLFYNRQLNEFYVVVSEFLNVEETNFEVYSLLSPPILKSELENPGFFRTTKLILFVVFGMIGLLAVLLLYRYFSNKNKEKAFTVSKELITQSIGSDNYSHKNSAVYLFGNFTAFDKKGTDISYRFSAKLKAMFIIILLFTKDESKISTEKLTSYLWPDKDTVEAKNIRGITINRLRNILVDMDGITLVHENSHWYFELTEAFYSDYREYNSLFSQLKEASKETFLDLMNQINPIISKGPFLINCQDEVIEKYKSDEEEKLEIILREYIFNLNAEKDYKQIIQISSAYFAAEPINNEIMEICYRAYTKLGKKEEAKAFFNNYKKTYKMMTGEEYKGI